MQRREGVSEHIPIFLRHPKKNLMFICEIYFNYLLKKTMRTFIKKKYYIENNITKLFKNETQMEEI